MKVCIIVKKNKPYIDKIIKLLKKKFNNLDVYFGDYGDDYPKNLNNKRYDILISYLSPWIINQKTLSKVKLFSLNFHPGPPEYPGIGCYNFAIYNNEINYGVTAHLMDKTVDTGKIIKVNKFKISKKITVNELIDKSYKSMFLLFKYVLKNMIVKKKLIFSNDNWKRKPFKRNEFKKLLIIKKDMSSNEIKKRIRATYFKGSSGPYIKLAGKKFELYKND